ncbi:hypothetical protein [Bifidobacterium animalis]|nr:hypothetical protein [Bifidobacterium animalis]
MPLNEVKILLKMIYDHMHIGHQDHTVNQDVQKLVRRVFNRYAVKQLDISNPSCFGTESKDSRASQAKREYAPHIISVRMTSGKGKEIHFAPEGETQPTIYLSRSSSGLFPNDPGLCSER